MTDEEKDYHVVLKIYEFMHLTLKHYLPLGKPLPDAYRDYWYSLYTVIDSGAFDSFVNDPLETEQVKQLDMFLHMKTDEKKEENENNN